MCQFFSSLFHFCGGLLREKFVEALQKEGMLLANGDEKSKADMEDAVNDLVKIVQEHVTNNDGE